jgi:hypothetical protein
MSGAIPPLPNTPSWRGARLKHRDNFTFTLMYFPKFSALVFSNSLGHLCKKFLFHMLLKINRKYFLCVPLRLVYYAYRV